MPISPRTLLVAVSLPLVFLGAVQAVSEPPKGETVPKIATSPEQRAFATLLAGDIQGDMSTLTAEKASGTLRYPVVEKGIGLRHGKKIPIGNKHFMSLTGDYDKQVVHAKSGDRRLDLSDWKGETAELTYDGIWTAKGGSGWTCEAYWKDGKLQLVTFFSPEPFVAVPRLFLTGMLGRDWLEEQMSTPRSTNPAS